MTTVEKSPVRYLSLDVLRGMTVALMIVVNSPGNWSAIYAPFKHAAWHGFTLTDLIFPTFLFVVGNAISFSFRKIEDLGTGEAIVRIGKRSMIIFLIGWLLNYFPFFNFDVKPIAFLHPWDVRLFGVLQRIALCYFFASLIIYRWRNTIVLVLISIIILLAYWAVLNSFGSNNDPFSLGNNAVTRSDNFLFNANILYQGFGISFEPEGLLSTLPAIVNVLAGYMTGKFLRSNGNRKSTALRLCAVSAALLLLAVSWNTVFPINKPIWTSSYVLFSLGWDILITATLIFIIDLMAIRKWTYFFEVFGKNPLFIYILAWVILSALYLVPLGRSTLPSLFYNELLMAYFSEKTSSLIFAITYMLLLWSIGLVLDRKKIYVRV